MDVSRRTAIKTLCALAALPCLPSARASDKTATVVRINMPGPRALAFMPVELIPALGIDRALGAQLVIRYFPSGVRAFEDVLAGNAHFSAMAFAVLPILAAKGQQGVAVSMLSGKTTPFAILVRTDLAGKIKKVGDLKGRSIGVATGSVNSKTYLNMLAEVLLSGNGVKSHEVRWVPMAQNFDAVYGALAGQAVDAVFCEEPFVSELVRKGAGRILLDLTDPRVAAGIPGSDHPRSVVATSAEFAKENRHLTGLMAQMVARALAWMRDATPEKIIDMLRVADGNERRELIAALGRAPGMYSPDGNFARKQIEATLVFLRAAGVSLPASLDVHSLVMYQGLK